MDVEDFREGEGDAAEADLELAIAFEGGVALDGGGFGFDVGEDGGDFGDLAAHFGLELGDESVCAAEWHGLVDFQMLVYMQGATEFLHCYVVDGEVGAGGDGADAIVDAFGEGGCRDGVNDDVGAGEMALDGFCRGLSELLGALEGEVPGQAEGDIGEECWARWAGTEAVDGEDAIYGGEVADDVTAKLGMGGSGVGEGVDGAAGEEPADAQDDCRDDDCSDGVGKLKRGNVPALSGEGGGESDENGGGGPYVCGEVDGICFECFAMVLLCDAMEVAGADVVHGNGEQEDQEGPDGESEGEVLAE